MPIFLVEGVTVTSVAVRTAIAYAATFTGADTADLIFVWEKPCRVAMRPTVTNVTAVIRMGMRLLI